MQELIDKRSLLMSLVNWQMEQFSEVGHEREFNLLEMLIHGVENEPAVEVIPVVHGEWVDGKCSNCGEYIPTDTRIDFVDEEDCAFCYSCGADMRKKVRYDTRTARNENCNQDLLPNVR